MKLFLSTKTSTVGSHLSLSLSQKKEKQNLRTNQSKTVFKMYAQIAFISVKDFFLKETFHFQKSRSFYKERNLEMI